MNTVKIRTPQDLVDVVDSMLGFHPTDSLVVLSLGGGPCARVDLRPGGVDDAVGSLAEPFNRHGIEAVMVLAYTDDEDLADTATRAMAGALTGETLHRGWVTPEGLVKLLGAGVLGVAKPQIARTRDEEAALLATQVDDLAVPDLGWTRRQAAEWLEANVDRLYDGFGMSDEDAVTFAWCVSQAPVVRDFAYGRLDQAAAVRAAGTLSNLVSRLSGEYRQQVAAVLAFVYWLAGKGAQSFMAVDLADPSDRLVQVVNGLLEGAVNPGTWRLSSPPRLDSSVL